MTWNGWPASTDSKRPGTPRTDSRPCRIAVVADSERSCRVQRAERVLDVEAPPEPHVDTVERARIGRSERDRLGKLLRQPAPVLVADVHDGKRPRIGEEQLPLRLEVRLHVAVEVQVVLAEIREHQRREADAVEPVEDGRVRRGLHRARAVAGVEHLAEHPLQVDRLGRGAHDTAPLAADPRLDRPEQAGTPPRGCEDREQEEARRRLAARTGDADHLELPRRLAEEHIRSRSHRRARVADDDLRHGQVECALDDERDGPALHCLRREVVAVGTRARHGEEERARTDRTGVVGEIAHLDRWAPEHLHRLERCDEALQIHLGRECTREGSGYLILRSGGTSRYWRSKDAICSNAGAATRPP